MYKNSNIIIEILEQIDSALEKIIYRFEPIKTVSDFTNSPQGMEKLDSICMLFVAIGESLKSIDKLTNNELLANYPNINWRGIKGFWDILSHHYFDIDAEQVFWLCENETEKLKLSIKEIINDINKSYDRKNNNT